MHPRKRVPRLAARFVAVAAMLAAMLAVPAGAVAAPDDGADKIEPSLYDTLASKGSADLWVHFDSRADLSDAAAVDDWADRGAAVVTALEQTAQASQAQAVALLENTTLEYEPFSVTNRVYVHDATAAVATSLAALPDVTRLTSPQTFQIPTPEPGAVEQAVDAVEWGVAAVNADDVWSSYGVRGEGVVVANIDTGVQFDHPALAGAYRGNTGGGTVDHNYSWFDPSQVCGSPSTAPCDNNGHGTHTMGTMVGDDGAGNQVGVAPGARWIAAKGCESSSCSDLALISSGQWMLAPTDLAGQNPRPDLRPHIVNNSWGAANGSVEDPFYDDVVAAWNAAGIFGVFSNGNSGPGCDTTGSPADSRLAYGVGAFDSAGAIAGFSSRGPGAEGDMRPSIAAPGVSVRSSVPGNGYASYSGTSMAAPHLSGVVALLWSAAPALADDVTTTRTILDETAVDVADLQCGGTAADNNVWGEGKVDALAAVAAAPRGPTGTLSGTVTDAVTGDPVAGARVAVSGPIDRTTTTGADGTYSLLLSTGDYTAGATTFGYQPGTAQVSVAQDAVTVQDFALDPAPAHPVSGHVRDDAGEPVANASVTIRGTPIPPVVTDANGAYAFASVPEGSYEVEASAGTCLAPQQQPLVVDGPETLDFAMARRTDGFGYSCGLETPSWVAGDTLVPLTGDDRSTQLTLPFPFTLYGETYDTAHVATNGHLNFLARSTAFSNTTIPRTTAPNAAVYPFWDDLYVDSAAGVYTATLGEAPNRRFVVEWRNVRFYGSTASRFDAEAVLHESGDVVFQYRGLDAGQPRELGSSATVGIENAAGTDAFEYSYNAAALSDSVAIRFGLPPNGFVQGRVTDRNDGEPVAGATVLVRDGDTVVRQGTTRADGTYRLQVFLGEYAIEASAPDYTPVSDDLVLAADGETVTRDFSLATARAEVTPGSLEFLASEGFTRSADVMVGNTGSADLVWEAVETQDGQPTDLPWLVAEPTAGGLVPGAQTALTVTVDTTGLTPGVYTGAVELRTNSGRQAVVTVPVQVVVSAYRIGVNAAGPSYTDLAGDPWVPDQPYVDGGFGYLDAGRTFTTRGDVSGTDDDPLYLGFREGTSGYRFDGLPAGTYQVELLFAEPRASARSDVRVFDVSLNGDYVLTGHDVAAEAGGLAADRHEFLVTVEENGSVEVGLHARRGYVAPLVNAVRVTHRPDL